MAGYKLKFCSCGKTLIDGKCELCDKPLKKKQLHPLTKLGFWLVLDYGISAIDAGKVIGYISKMKRILK